MKLFASTIALSFLLGTVCAQDNSSFSSSDNNYVLRECTVVLIEDIDLPALESGQLTDIMVKPGTSVTKNQKVAQMNDTRSRRALEEAQLRHRIASEQANDSTEVNASFKRAELAKAEYDKTRKLRQTGSMSEQQTQRSRVSAQIARYEYDGARKLRDRAAMEAAAEMVTVQASQDSINRHAIKSPITGVVYEVNKDAGEWVTAGETVMKIARMDKLRVTRLVDGSQFHPQQLAGRKVSVKHITAGNREVEFTGEVVFVDPQKRLNNQFMLWADIDNRMITGSGFWVLQSGDEVNMTIHLDESVAQSAGRSVSGGSTK